MAKLKSPLDAFTSQQHPLQVPSSSRLLRFQELPDHSNGVSVGQQVSDKRLKLDSETWYEAVFGAPWGCEDFIQRACKAGHPLNFANCLDTDLLQAVDKHVEWSADQLASYRISWRRKWLKRSVELAPLEKESLLKRPLSTCKKLLNTKGFYSPLKFFQSLGMRTWVHWSCYIKGQLWLVK